MQPVENDAISELVESIWTSVLGLDLRRSTGPAAPGGKEPFVTGCVQITGTWEGALTLDCSAALARKTAAIMFNTDPETVSAEEVRDALGELTNMAGGNVKALLPGPCRLSLPAVIEGLDYRVMVPGAHPVSRVVFDCHGEPLRVSLLKGDAPSPDSPGSGRERPGGA